MTKYNLLDELIAQAKISKKTTDKQQRIIEASIKLFAEKGFANTSTSEIAKEAGVAEGTIFRHYRTKDNLLLSIMLPFFRDAVPSMAEEVFAGILSKNPPRFEDFLKALLVDRLQFFKENKEIFQVVVKELFYSENLRKEISDIFSEHILSRLDKVIEVYKQKGEIRDLEAASIRKLIFTLFASFIVSRLVLFPNLSEITEKEVDEIIHFVMDGIRAK